MQILDFQKPDEVIMINEEANQGSFEFRPLEHKIVLDLHHQRRYSHLHLNYNLMLLLYYGLKIVI